MLTIFTTACAGSARPMRLGAPVARPAWPIARAVVEACAWEVYARERAAIPGAAHRRSAARWVRKDNRSLDSMSAVLYYSCMNDIRRDHESGQQLLTMLRHAAGVIENRLERAVEARGLSLAKLGVLHALEASGGSLSLGRLADYLSCVRSNITQLVDRLEVEGLVRREPDPEDRRSILATITEEGQRLYEAASEAQDAAEREILGEMPAEQRQQLAALLHEIGTAIE